MPGLAQCPCCRKEKELSEHGKGLGRRIMICNDCKNVMEENSKIQKNGQRTWTKNLLLIIIPVVIAYGIWFDYLDSVIYALPGTNYVNNCATNTIPVGNIPSWNQYYQYWNILGHFIPSLFLLLKHPKKWEIAGAGFLISTVVMDTPVWGVEVLHFHNYTNSGIHHVQCLKIANDNSTTNIIDWMKFYYNPVGTYGVWGENSLCPTSFHFWSIIARIFGASAACPTAGMIFWSIITRLALAFALIGVQRYWEEKHKTRIDFNHSVIKKRFVRVRDNIVARRKKA